MELWSDSKLISFYDVKWCTNASLLYMYCYFTKMNDFRKIRVRVHDMVAP